MKKLIALLAVVFVGISLSACQASDSRTDAPSKISASATKEAPVSLNGTWKAEGFEATIAADSIVINIVSTDSKSLYWKGTFSPSTDKVASVADRDALDASLLGSQDSDKVFVIDGDKITFEITMAGTTKTVKLEKA